MFRNKQQRYASFIDKRGRTDIRNMSSFEKSGFESQ